MRRLYFIIGPNPIQQSFGRNVDRRRTLINHPHSGVFLRELQRALQYLYDPAELRKNQLVRLFGLEKRANPAFDLREILTSATKAQEPGPDIPLQSNAWRIYHVLTYLYLEQSTQAVVAANLGISTRELRRQLRDAEEILASYLWANYSLENQVDEVFASRESTKDASPTDEQLMQREHELEWLRESFPTEITKLSNVIASALKTIEPILKTANVQIDTLIPVDLPPITGQIALLRQALVNLLSAASLYQPGGEIKIDVEMVSRGLRVAVISTHISESNKDVGAQIRDHIDMSRELIHLFGGALEEETSTLDSSSFRFILVLPTADQVPVLIVEDNSDTLRLFQRYLMGTRYRFAGCRDPKQAITLALEVQPAIVVMDVMMPQMSDWELLGQFREHPNLQNIPIIVCTILPENKLAEILGAASFIRKPISREDFLKALDQQMAFR